MNENQKPDLPGPGQQAPSWLPYPYEGEFSLTDAFVVILRHKQLTITILVMWIIVSTAVTYMLPKRYRYFASLEIGSRVVWQNGKIDTILIDQPENIVTKIEQSFWPTVLRRYSEQKLELEQTLEINVHSPANSRVIVMELTAEEDKADLTLKILKEILDLTIASHSKLAVAIREIYTSQLKHARLELEATENFIKSLEQTSTPTWPSNLVNRTSAELNKAGAELDKEKLQTKFNEIEDIVHSLRETQILSEPMRSSKNVGTSRLRILILSVLAGFLVSFLAAYLVEYTKRAQKELEQEASV